MGTLFKEVHPKKLKAPNIEAYDEDDGPYPVENKAKRKKLDGLIPAIDRNLQHARETNNAARRIRDLITGAGELKGESEQPDPSGLTAKVDISTDVMQNTYKVLEQILEELQ
jgi:hypothetical protein